MKIYDKTLTKELSSSEIDLNKGKLEISKKTTQVVNNGVLENIVEDVLIYIPFYTEESIENLRTKRSNECFAIINRGDLFWHMFWNKFNINEVDQKQKELQDWYQAWLDVTQTKQIPSKPTWLN